MLQYVHETDEVPIRRETDEVPIRRETDEVPIRHEGATLRTQYQYITVGQRIMRDNKKKQTQGRSLCLPKKDEHVTNNMLRRVVSL